MFCFLTFVTCSKSTIKNLSQLLNHKYHWTGSWGTMILSWLCHWPALDLGPITGTFWVSDSICKIRVVLWFLVFLLLGKAECVYVPCSGSPAAYSDCHMEIRGHFFSNDSSSRYEVTNRCQGKSWIVCSFFNNKTVLSLLILHWALQAFCLREIEQNSRVVKSLSPALQLSSPFPLQKNNIS